MFMAIVMDTTTAMTLPLGWEFRSKGRIVKKYTNLC